MTIVMIMWKRYFIRQYVKIDLLIMEENAGRSENLNENELLEIIGKGECHMTEFKKSTTDITKDVYESICAFSNRDGGHVFLGVKDNGRYLV